ncbi:MAG: ROK family protein [Myxococcales bacterium]|nr:ROK family protein [Myxococcales bacterium]
MAGSTSLIAAIEAGGTKFNCAVARADPSGTSAGEILAETRIETTQPEPTLQAVAEFFSEAQAAHGSIATIGIGTFGPVDLNPASPTWGWITSTPKPGWENTALAPFFQQRFGVPVAFDTDVNAAVLAERWHGAGLDQDPLVYVTIGTGVGGGVWANGGLVHGLIHPEIGHLHVPAPEFSQALRPEGACPFHSSCVEGYVCGPALAKRWGVPANQLSADSPAWREAAEVLAYLCLNLTCTLSPGRIILGGGVMEQPQLLPLVQQSFVTQLNGYLRHPRYAEEVAQYIVKPGLGGRAGLVGALELARTELRRA